jgi:hypothetical protein
MRDLWVCFCHVIVRELLVLGSDGWSETTMLHDRSVVGLLRGLGAKVVTDSRFGLFESGSSGWCRGSGGPSSNLGLTLKELIDSS